MKTAIFIFVTTLFITLPVWAETPQSALGEQAGSLGAALEKANKYSFDSGGVAIIISYGTGNTGSPERIGKTFVKEIKKRGQKSKYFVHYVDWPGVTMSYRIGYSSFGPWNVTDAASNIGNVVRRAEAAHRIHRQ